MVLGATNYAAELTLSSCIALVRSKLLRLRPERGYTQKDPPFKMVFVNVLWRLGYAPGQLYQIGPRRFDPRCVGQVS